MPSDRARRSYDAGRMYRSVVSQQGRVTLEADANEAEEIRTAEARAGLIDIVGPTGSPDDGFKVSLSGSGFDFRIGQGTFYLGGLRVVNNDANATYLTQKAADWADYPAGAPASYPDSKITELAYIAVTEQEVSAVEDPALREVALGGPDTAGRTRLIPRVHRAPIASGDCDAELGKLLAATSPGLTFDPETMRLTSTARLKVDFVSVTGPVDQCQPTAKPGFLGAENQLIRVQVTSQGKLLWGYDNASFLYRATIDRSKPTELALTGTPVDVFHQPRAAQWVEVLGTAVNLGAGAYVAQPVGVTGEVLGYEPAGNVITLTMATAIPAAFFDSQPAQVFVRLWEKELTVAANGTTPAELVKVVGGSTGIQIVLDGTAVAGDYWMIGVRPGVPDAVFPARLRQFQPPDGPGRWASALATIAWNPDLTTGAVHDCRRPFDNLVELTRAKCCELKVLPGDDAQKIISRRLEWNAKRGIFDLHVRFAAGVFTLDTPLVLDAPSGGELTVSGCGTTLVAATQEVALVLRNWDRASVFDLSVAATIARPGRGKSLRQDLVPPAPGDEFRHVGGAITFLDCGSSTVERVVASCGTGDQRAASCVTIRNRDDHAGDARVRCCEFSAGSRQVGVLLVNVQRATVEDNRIGWHAPAKARIPPDALRRALISEVKFGRHSRPRQPEWQVRQSYQLRGDRTVYFHTHSALANLWQAAFATIAERISPAGAEGLTNQDWRRLQRAMTSILTQILHRHREGRRWLEPGLLGRFRGWVDSVLSLEQTVAAAGQGIVVGGTRAQDVRILNNTIADAMDGIHIGLSTRGSPATHLFADRVQVVGNTISVRVPWYERGGHAGIFVGNANVTTVRDNRVEIQFTRPEQKTSAEDEDLNMDGLSDAERRRREKARRNREKARQGIVGTRRAVGIRVWGMPGRMLLVTGNCSERASIGIHVVQESAPPAALLFQLTHNLAVDVDVAIAASAGVTTADNVPAA